MWDTSRNDKKYDIILFGVTGFTGKIAAEFLIEKQLQQTSPTIQFAVCARDKARASSILHRMADAKRETLGQFSLPDILVADLLCASSEDEERLKHVVGQTKVALTCAGPFEKFGKKLVQFCAELGVHYADITGETDFVRSSILAFDQMAQASGSKIVHHCGNDCIPQDLTVYEMNQFARSKDCELVSVNTYVEMSESTSFSGGTAATAIFQLNKDRSKENDKPEFDPLLTSVNGSKSDFLTNNISPKKGQEVPELGCNATPWIMGPVMVNCVRRSK